MTTTVVVATAGATTATVAGGATAPTATAVTSLPPGLAFAGCLRRCLSGSAVFFRAKKRLVPSGASLSNRFLFHKKTKTVTGGAGAILVVLARNEVPRPAPTAKSFP